MNAGVRMQKNWPDVIQLAFCQGGSEPVTMFYLKNEQPIHPRAQSVHKISQEFLDEKGMDAREGFLIFLEACKQSDCLVAHNIKFDRNVVIAQGIRLGLDVNPILALTPYCTMRSACNFVKSRPRRISGKVVYKMPRLEECASFSKSKSLVICTMHARM